MSSYRVLARKWRPQKFDDIVGQEAVVRTLRNALHRNRVAHALIFSGVRGVGKTTIARIMAKAINCHNQDEAPCDRCPSCEAIIAGNAMDLHEIDGASNRGIQEIRDLKENIRFLPAQERFKVIIIDEVHMLTTEAFNALLKTLEEPPEHVFFMFATTEIHKVPVTILSRCQRYELKRVPFKLLYNFFAKISQKEGVEISQAALEIIAGEADGSVRDGLSLLDQIFSFGGDSVTEEDLRLVLGLVDRRIFAKIVAALLTSDLALALTLLNDSYCQGMDLKRFAQGLLFYCRALLVVKSSKTPATILDLSDQEMKAVHELAAGFSLETLSTLFSLMMKGVEEMQHAAHPRMVLEMLFVKAVQIGTIVPLNSILSRFEALLAGHPEPLSPPQSVSVASLMPVKEPLGPEHVPGGGQSTDVPVDRPPVASPQTSSPDIPSEPMKSGSSDDPANVVADEDEDTDEMEAVPSSVSSSVVTAVPARSLDVQREWEAFLDHVRERKKWMAVTLSQADRVAEEGGALVIRYDESSECHILQETENRKLLTELAQDFFQRELPVRIVVAGESGGVELDQPQEERRALAKEPRVQIAVEVFGGQIAGIRTGPRSR